MDNIGWGICIFITWLVWHEDIIKSILDKCKMEDE